MMKFGKIELPTPPKGMQVNFDTMIFFPNYDGHAVAWRLLSTLTSQSIHCCLTADEMIMIYNLANKRDVSVPPKDWLDSTRGYVKDVDKNSTILDANDAVAFIDSQMNAHCKYEILFNPILHLHFLEANYFQQKSDASNKNLEYFRLRYRDILIGMGKTGEAAMIDILGSISPNYTEQIFGKIQIPPTAPLKKHR